MSTKTNVMRILDSKKVEYKTYEYKPDRSLSGSDVANLLGFSSSQVFKTLVTQGKSGNYYVFVIPSDHSLNLKKAANSVGEKSIEMLKEKNLLPLTGYVHGGCSPIGMKKFFHTVFHDSAKGLQSMLINAGKLGYQVEVNINDLKAVIEFSLADIVD